MGLEYISPAKLQEKKCKTFISGVNTQKSQLQAGETKARMDKKGHFSQARGIYYCK